MKIFKKVKKNNGKVKFYLFGIKIFSYKKKPVGDGKKYFCPVCGNTNYFLPMNTRKNAICPVCGSFERTRFQFHVYSKYFLNGNKKVSLLHFAPEKVFYDMFKSNKNINYTCCDLFPEMFPYAKDLKKEDGMKMSFENKTFDVVISSHVLEHVPNAKGFIKEQLRVLKDGGIIFCSFPQNKLKDSWEDKSIKTPEKRKENFGQEDHVRLLGKDFKKYLADKTYTIQEIKPEDFLSEKIIESERLEEKGTDWKNALVIIKRKK